MRKKNNQPTEWKHTPQQHNAGKAFSLSRWRLIKWAALKYVPLSFTESMLPFALQKSWLDSIKDNFRIPQPSNHSLLNSFFPKMHLLSTLIQLTFLNTNMQNKILNPKEAINKKKTKQKNPTNQNKKKKLPKNPKPPKPKRPQLLCYSHDVLEGKNPGRHKSNLQSV